MKTFENFTDGILYFMTFVGLKEYYHDILSLLHSFAKLGKNDCQSQTLFKVCIFTLEFWLQIFPSNN